jgi:pyruvate kinase
LSRARTLAVAAAERLAAFAARFRCALAVVGEVTAAALAAAGADVFRLNFSHGAHEDHAAACAAVRLAEKSFGRPLAVLADLQGPKLRLGKFVDGKAAVERGDVFRLDLDPAPGDRRRVGVPHAEIFAALAPGAAVLIDDGRIRLQVESCDGRHAVTRVVQGGWLADRKGVSVPGAVLPLTPLTAKDRADLAFALTLGVDWVALSFVQRPEDMAELRALVGNRAAILAKIEKPAALEVLGAILDRSDGVMVARGDLGVELAPEDVPVAQKTILRAALERGLPAIVATQMLESMINNPTPTRAEASDVATAVYEGADALMLSAETASGEFPIETVAMMARIIARVEQDPRWPRLMDAEHAPPADAVRDAIPSAARIAAGVNAARCIVTFTASGATALRMARERPMQTVLALTPNLATARRLALVGGLEPCVVEDIHDLDEMTERAAIMVARCGLSRPGDPIAVIAGVPFGRPGPPNLLRLTSAAM